MLCYSFAVSASLFYLMKYSEYEFVVVVCFISNLLTEHFSHIMRAQQAADHTQKRQQNK